MVIFHIAIKRPCILDQREFTVYESITNGDRFFSSNSKTSTDRRRLLNGCIAYRILGEADTPEEARKLCTPNFDVRSDNIHNIEVGKFFVDIELTSLGHLALTVRKQEHFDGLEKAVTILIPESLERKEVII